MHSPSKLLRGHQSSRESNKSGDSSGLNLQKWFDSSNERPHLGFHTTFQDSEPPYFLPQESTNTSNDAYGSRKPLSGHLKPGTARTATNGSGAEEYRSVIDDLTIENKKLRERLRKHENAYNRHLEKDKLFEVKIHGLPLRKRRELEDVLRAFASSMHDSTGSETHKGPSKGAHLHPYSSFDPTLKSSSKNPSSSSRSHSRPLDSAYASMSNSGPTSTSTVNHVSLEGKVGESRQHKEQKIHSFLHNIPGGLLPKHPPAMTERQKKKVVVQRLEQLFTGKKAIIGEHSQPLQQQEVARSAALADQSTDDDSISKEGVREANMLPYVDSRRPAKIPGKLTAETQTSESSGESSPDQRTSLDQRPTRPLDLDPDRAQIPSENVKYIRHLGLPTPQLTSENPADATAEAEGWTYLNLLVNMAQLHIINVTPDFVRSAVAEVSEKFQLSEDGKKIRWRGGTQGTQLSSESDAGSGGNRFLDDSDSLEEGNRKRRKVDVGKFASVPADVPTSTLHTRTRGPSKIVHYTPLFHHRRSSFSRMMSSDESDSLEEYEMKNGGRAGRASYHPKMWNASSGLHEEKRPDEGPIVFYSGAKFYTDLSGDRGEISTPLHVLGVGSDGYSNQSQNAIGCSSGSKNPPFNRTPSGSMLSFRPFRDYSKVPNIIQTEEIRPKTPDLLETDLEDEDFFMDVSPESSSPSTPLQAFDASGLGGTQPADHFAVRVQTRRTKKAGGSSDRSRLSASGAGFKKFAHKISKASLESFLRPELDLEDSNDAQQASLTAPASPSPRTGVAFEDLPVKTDVLYTNFIRLRPSELPPPLGYHSSTTSTSENEDSDWGSSLSGVSHLRPDRSFFRKSYASFSDLDNAPDRFPEHAAKDLSMSDTGNDSDEEDNDSSLEEDENDDEDDSIDMLAHAREADPDIVAAKEREFDMEVDEKGSEAGSARSSLATVNDESGCSNKDG